MSNHINDHINHINDPYLNREKERIQRLPYYFQEVNRARFIKFYISKISLDNIKAGEKYCKTYQYSENILTYVQLSENHLRKYSTKRDRNSKKVREKGSI